MDGSPTRLLDGVHRIEADDRSLPALTTGGDVLGISGLSTRLSWHYATCQAGVTAESDSPRLMARGMRDLRVTRDAFPDAPGTTAP